MAELAFAVTDTFSDGDHSAASQLADTLLAVLGWPEPTDPAPDDRPYLAGPVRHGEQYAVIRLDYQPTDTATAARDSSRLDSASPALGTLTTLLGDRRHGAAALTGRRRCLTSRR